MNELYKIKFNLTSEFLPVSRRFVARVRPVFRILNFSPSKIMASQMHSNTDWDTVTVIGKKNPNARAAKSSAALNSAGRSGAGIISEKKTGLNQKKTTEGSRIAKVDRMTDV